MTGGGEGGAFEPPDEPPPGPSKRARVDDDATPRHLRAVEFYCGVGGLHYSLLRARPDAKVVAAFDINPNGNDVYEHNFGVRPSQKNIYGLPVASFDKLDAGLWLLSPPCQPFTRQGHRKDKDDGRSQSFLRLLRDVVPELDKPPTHVLVENVVGFETSETRADAIAVFHRLGYDTREFMLTPRMFGVPYSRPRYFLLAKKSAAAAGGGGWSDGDWGEWLASHSCGPIDGHGCGPIRAPPPSRLSGHREWVPRGASCVLPAEFEGDTKAEFDARHRAIGRVGDKEAGRPKPNPADNPLYGYPVALVGAFLDGSGHDENEGSRDANVGSRDVFREYAVAERDAKIGLGAVDVVCRTSYKCNCFTKSYGKYVKGTGSMVTDKLVDKDAWDGTVASGAEGAEGGVRLRYFTEGEIARMHSFPSDFSFPAGVTRQQRYALLGNSLSVACVAPLIDHLLNDPSVDGERPPPRREVVGPEDA
mmetsp:Transcript_6321/g.25675  ORF Transcript_6321/g.25675 Transcript_6321/m.25675 type:complete len:476 (-) Transcript_6321:1244-2671(-)